MSHEDSDHSSDEDLPFTGLTWFGNIEAGYSHPRLGAVVGYMGFALGILPVCIVTTHALASIFGSRVVPLEATLIGAFFYSFLVFLPVSHCYKIAHENGGENASAPAYRGFCSILLAFIVAIAFTMAAGPLRLKMIMHLQVLVS